MTKKSVSAKAVYAFLFLALFLALASANARGGTDELMSYTDGYSIQGVWTGTAPEPSYASITLTVKPNERKLRYGSPRSCELTLEEPRNADDDTLIFGVSASSGGWCDRLLMGSISVRADIEIDSLIYVVKDHSGKVLEEGKMRRTGT